MSAAEGIPPAGAVASIKLGPSESNNKAYELFYETWAPEGRIEAKNIVAFYFPGVLESADTLHVRRLGSELSKNGYKLICLEYHGHGRSVGDKETLGLIESFELLKEHAIQFIQAILNENQRFIVIGHSLGGAVAAYIGDELQELFDQPKFIGEILLAPAVLGPKLGVLTYAALTIVAKVAPKLPIGPVEDPNVYDTKSGKQLNYAGKMRAQTALILVNLMKETEEQMRMSNEDRALKMRFPFVIFQGTRDPVIPLGKARAFYEFAESPNKEFHTVESRSHQLLLERKWKDLTNAFIRWIEKQDE